MPAWGKLLGPDRVKLVAAWVLSQSNAPAADAERTTTP
jgi:mono/diheme cytochrome c family protein